MRWLTRRHDCTLAGIQKRCGGKCCTSDKFWPPSAYAPKSCEHLGVHGCTLTQEARPVVCSLYPLRVVKGTLVLYIRSTYPKGLCAGNHGKGPLIIDALKSSLVALFGQEQYDRVRNDMLEGRNSFFQPSPELAKRIEREEKLAVENKKFKVNK